MNVETMPWEHTLSRRQLLGSAALGAAAIGAGGLGPDSLLQAAIADEVKKKHKQVLFIWIDGGMVVAMWSAYRRP